MHAGKHKTTAFGGGLLVAKQSCACGTHTHQMLFTGTTPCTLLHSLQRTRLFVPLHSVKWCTLYTSRQDSILDI